MITVQKGWHDTPETLLTLCGDLRFRLRERIQIEIFPSINRERSFRDLLGKLLKSDLFDGERKVLLLFFLFISVFSYSMLAIYIAQRRRFVILYENSYELWFLFQFIDRRRYEMARYRFRPSIYFDSSENFDKGTTVDNWRKGRSPSS